MATLGALRQRIITEMVRTDLAEGAALASVLDQQIQAAIWKYATERFWFNEVRSSGVLTVNSQYVNLPSGALEVDALWVVIGGVNYKLEKRSMEFIEDLYTVPQFGQPMSYAIYERQARMWPTPQIAYPTVWLTISEVMPALSYADGSTTNSSVNAWTTQGFDLITARTKMNLFRDQFRDEEGYQLASLAEQVAYRNLKGQTNRLLGSGRIRSSW